MKIQLLKVTLPIIITLNLSANIYTVDDLILKAMENSPDLKISSAKYLVSKEKLNIADSNYLPVIDLQVTAGQFGQSDILNGNSDTIVDSSAILGTISAKQLIYDFGKTSENINIYKYSSESYLMAKKQKISDKIKDVKTAYYNVLQSIALINVNKENVKLNKAQLYRSEKYFQAGIRTKIDVSDAKVGLIRAKLNLKESEYNLKISYASLDKIVGFIDLNLKYSVFSKKLNLNNLYQSLKNYNLNLAESINFAYKNRYEIKQYIAQKKSVKANTKLSSSEFYPSFFFYGDYTKQNILDKQLKSNLPEDKWSATLNMKWNLYEGGSTTAVKQESKIKLNISNSELQYLKLSIKKDTTEAFINVNKMKDSVKLSQSLLKVSDEKYNQASKRYEYGLSDYIELQEARQGYIDSKATLVINYYNYYSAIAILDNSIGK